MVGLRPMGADDAGRVAQLHTTSWRHAYRGILDDGYLAGDLLADRLGTWDEKLARGDGRGWIAFDGDDPIGFVYLRPREDPRWGSLVDNLHVLATHQGGGVGRRLLHAVGAWCLTHAGEVGVHLWVFDDNHPARAFYRRVGGVEVEGVDRLASDGRMLPEQRVAWASPAALHRGTAAGGR